MFSCNDEVCVFFVYNYPLWFSIFDSGSIMELFCVTGVLNADPCQRFQTIVLINRWWECEQEGRGEAHMDVNTAHCFVMKGLH